MTPTPHTRWSKLEEVFHAALERAKGDRTRYLREACAGDEALEREARALLTGHEHAAAFIEPMRAEDVAGRRIGAYTLVRIIGAGGMGAVYEARQDHPERAVALKVLRGALGSRGSLRRFEEEAAILARLRHPGIAQVFEAGTFDSGAGPTPFFAMELIEGASPLTTSARERKLPPRERLALFLAVCDAVAHGHQRAIIHRDLKPANILVGADGAPKVIDFGVARTLGDPAHTVTQQFVGTLSYMSPEQCTGPTHSGADVRSDVYALGVILFELLTDARPYDVDEKSLPEAARIIREEAPPRPSSIIPDLRGDLETIILKALEKDPLRRYQSVAELADDLQRFLTERPILARTAAKK
jgi:serine/threonine protein kinase